jgi:hypothetical protein
VAVAIAWSFFHLVWALSIDVALRRLKSEAAHESETGADVEAITALAQAILKREWHRVKAGT